MKLTIKQLKQLIKEQVEEAGRGSTAYLDPAYPGMTERMLTKHLAKAEENIFQAGKILTIVQLNLERMELDGKPNSIVDVEEIKTMLKLIEQLDSTMRDIKTL